MDETFYYKLVFPGRIRLFINTHRTVVQEFLGETAAGGKDHYGDIFIPGIAFEHQQDFCAIGKRHIMIQDNERGQLFG